MIPAMRPMDEATREQLRDEVNRLAATAGVRERVERVYADLQSRIDQRRPRCDASGRCCRFEQFGHRLYVTTLELAAFVARLRERPPGGRVNADPGGCAFQIDGLCSVHAIRPFGCRVFFCDPAAADWQEQTYGEFHARLRALHGELGAGYRYVEWREALEAIGLPVSPATSDAASAPGPGGADAAGRRLVVLSTREGSL
jgi:Fe-S-cluster containining protein